MKIKYKACHISGRIEQIQIESESKKFVTIDGRKNQKEGGYWAFFDTREQAKEWLINQVQRGIQARLSEIEHAKNWIEMAKQDLTKRQAL
jgi:hypothetical protein